MSPKTKSPRARLVLIDGTNSLYRAFFAIPGLRAPDGTPTNAALGFISMLGKVIREEQPTGVVVVFDARGKNFRHELFSEYKAGRDAQPEDLSAQFPLVKELVEAHAIPILEIAGCEADDVIATLVALAPEGTEIRIVSSDKDLMQLVSDDVQLLDGMKDRRYGPADVEERFGVPPRQVLDLRALVGDPSDNIPGVKGIGQKGAAKLISEWETLENLLDHIDEVAPKRAQTALANHTDDARLSKELSTLHTDISLPLDVAALTAPTPDVGKLRKLYERFHFTRLLDALGDDGGSTPGEGDHHPVEVQVIANAADLAAVMEMISKRASLCMLPLIRWKGALVCEPVGLALALGGDRAAWIPFEDAGVVSGETASLFDAAARKEREGLPLADVIEALRPLVEQPGQVGWVGIESKHLHTFFAERGLELATPWFDVEIAAHLLDPDGSQGLPRYASKILGRSLRSWDDLAGRGKKEKAIADLDPEAVALWACEQVIAISDLQPVLAQQLEEVELTSLYEEIELPLAGVLARMEREGFRIDEDALAKLGAEYGTLLEAIVRRIHELAGEEFLISSPKQLQYILFEKLKLRVIKKTKTGYSTDEGVLEQLAIEHDLPAEVLDYRRLSKLKSTYVDALPPLVNPATGRIHPTFNQLGAATGRLSATNPNVQNIPIRTEEGIRIREAFIPAEGRLLLSADYSQVELRILAHYSEDESLIEAFRADEDIHRRTAAEVNGLAPEDVSDELRARAKAVNFGIIYGSSAFGLARQLGIASGDAQATIDAYFERYRGVRRFLDETIARAKEEGFVRTLLGRRRYLPDLTSRNRVLRQASERMAVNTVIQGTAADLIKRAMLAVDAAIRSDGLGAKMILQVHDELVFEVSEAEIGALTDLVREKMEGAIALRVPLRVDIGSGVSWREAH